MNRAVTAIYRTYEAAAQVRDAIIDSGVSSAYVDIIPDSDDMLAEGSFRDDEVLDDLHDLYLPEGDVRTYQQAVRRGDFVLSANVDEDEVGRVAELMREPQSSLYDIDAVEHEFRDESLVRPMGAATTGVGRTIDDVGHGVGEMVDDVVDGVSDLGHAAADATGLSGDRTAYGRDIDAVGGEQVLQEAHEELRVAKREIEGGSVHVRTYVHEVPVEERVRLRQERVEIRRMPSESRVLSGAEADAVFQDRSIDVTEHREEAVVSKETVVTGTVSVGKEVETEERVISDTVREVNVEVEDTRSGQAGDRYRDTDKI